MTGWLAFETRGLRTDSVRSSKAAETSAKVAEEMAQNRRAWITIRAPERTKHPNLRIPTFARVSFLNSGETPAFDVEISHTYVKHNPNDGQVTEGTFDYEDPLVVTRLPLGPRDEISIFNEFRYQSDNEKQLLEEQVTTLFWFGVVKYKDIFGNACSTKWCFEYDIKAQDFTPSYFHNDVT